MQPTMIDLHNPELLKARGFVIRRIADPGHDQKIPMQRKRAMVDG